MSQRRRAVMVVSVGAIYVAVLIVAVLASLGRTAREVIIIVDTAAFVTVVILLAFSRNKGRDDRGGGHT